MSAVMLKIMYSTTQQQRCGGCMYDNALSMQLPPPPNTAPLHPTQIVGGQWQQHKQKRMQTPRP